MTAKARFTQADVQRLIKGAQLAGLQVTRLEVEPTGKMTVFFTEDGEDEAESLAHYINKTPYRKRGRDIQWNDDDI